MVVFAWILFVVSALYALFSLFTGQFFSVLQSAGLIVYLVFFLFVTPLGAVASWIFFGVYCAVFLADMLLGKLFGQLQAVTGIIFILLLL